MRLIVLIVLVGIISSNLFAQEKLEFGDTPTTTSKPKYKPRDKDHRQRDIIHWVKPTAKGLYMGNKCVDELTYSMGFVYLIQVKGQTGYKSETNRLLHNLGAKIRILFRNGPFWKFKLKKKTKECRRETGDYIG
ncbi:hypothetical protein FNH22_17140 [Fulvivirga sp. M361]|uniref:hypothetical protein n=1 Tax=Fulvivirga sp. M361 TaxID=2594266 RepID=UPI00117A171E|nr:hypothetical protein [Fulvivirga sp. M361]TRX56104.1 hypothetical protein FNH22_17140 [Fulvivirga sp. M361]